jgi:hypothetical protein
MEVKGKIIKALSALKFGVRKLNFEDRFRLQYIAAMLHK